MQIEFSFKTHARRDIEDHITQARINPGQKNDVSAGYLNNIPFRASTRCVGGLGPAGKLWQGKNTYDAP